MYMYVKLCIFALILVGLLVRILQRNSSRISICWKRVLTKLIRKVMVVVGLATTSFHYHQIAGSIAQKLFPLTPNMKCSVCQRKCWNYCSCSPGTMICSCCFPLFGNGNARRKLNSAPGSSTFPSTFWSLISPLKQNLTWATCISYKSADNIDFED